MDRCSTVLNVTGDMTVCGIIGSMVKIDQRNSVRAAVNHQHQMHSSLYDQVGGESGAFSNNQFMSSRRSSRNNNNSNDVKSYDDEVEA